MFSPERPGKHGIAARLQLLEHLVGDEQERLPRPAVNLRVGVIVALEAQSVGFAHRDGCLRHATGGDVDLDHATGHEVRVAKLPGRLRETRLHDVQIAAADLLHIGLR